MSLIENVDIRILREITLADLQRLITGYVADARYGVEREEMRDSISFTLRIERLPQTSRKTYHDLDDESFQRYVGVLQHNLSFGAYEGDTLVGIALAEPQTWNNSLWVWEFHVAETHRGRGIGQRLMEALTQAAKSASLRIIVCETQTTNVPAINFYRKTGFRLEGIDLSYYSNTDWPDGEVAVFMKKRLS